MAVSYLHVVSFSTAPQRPPIHPTTPHHPSTQRGREMWEAKQDEMSEEWLKEVTKSLTSQHAVEEWGQQQADWPPSRRMVPLAYSGGRELNSVLPMIEVGWGGVRGLSGCCTVTLC